MQTVPSNVEKTPGARDKIDEGAVIVAVVVEVGPRRACLASSPPVVASPPAAEFQEL